MRVLPAELYLLYQQFVAEESLSVIRHDLRNKLGSIRNAAFYVRRKLDKIAPEVAIKDPRVPEFLAMIATEIPRGPLNRSCSRGCRRRWTPSP